MVVYFEVEAKFKSKQYPEGILRLLKLKKPYDMLVFKVVIDDNGSMTKENVL